MLEAELNNQHLKRQVERREQDMADKVSARRRLKRQSERFEGLTLEEGLIKKKALEIEAEEKKKRKEKNAFMKLWRMERDQVHKNRVAARAKKAERKRSVKKLEQQKQFISIEFVKLL